VGLGFRVYKYRAPPRRVYRKCEYDCQNCEDDKSSTVGGMN
jgi:hypothetical protein